MAAVNKVILIGNLGRDPEAKAMPSGEQVVNIALATTENWKDKNGEKQERTEWHRVVIFGKLAEIAAQYLHKGSQVYFEGSLRTRKWQNKEGADQYTTEIVADRMQMLGGPAEKQGSTEGAPAAKTAAPAKKKAAAPAAPANYPDDDDIPF